MQTKRGYRKGKEKHIGKIGMWSVKGKEGELEKEPLSERILAVTLIKK